MPEAEEKCKVMFEVQPSLSLPDFVATLKALDLEIMFQTMSANPAYCTTTSTAQNVQQTLMMTTVHDPASQKAMTNPNIAQPGQKTKNIQHFQEAETKLLLQQWEAFRGFKDKKKVSKDNWDALVRAYNADALVFNFVERSIDQCKNKIRNVIDQYKRIKDNVNSAGLGTGDTDKKSIPYYDIVNRVLGGRDVISDLVHVVDLGACRRFGCSSCPGCRKA